ncbi:TonB family protein [Reinekea sp.]|uniref:TonB family protein n=1 Tax=Reinekea sp. TaxID=1970455 RepID=UPI002A8381F2|nr:TonB family protein [Reinekea sp.]
MSDEAVNPSFTMTSSAMTGRLMILVGSILVHLAILGLVKFPHASAPATVQNSLTIQLQTRLHSASTPPSNRAPSAPKKELNGAAPVALSREKNMTTAPATALEAERETVAAATLAPLPIPTTATPPRAPEKPTAVINTEPEKPNDKETFSATAVPKDPPLTTKPSATPNVKRTVPAPLASTTITANPMPSSEPSQDMSSQDTHSAVEVEVEPKAEAKLPAATNSASTNLATIASATIAPATLASATTRPAERDRAPIFVAATFAGRPPVPIKPASAARKRLRGELVLRGFVSASGQLQQPYVQQSSGHAELDQAALEQALGWSFQPAMQNGIATGQWVEWAVAFR